MVINEVEESQINYTDQIFSSGIKALKLREKKHRYQMHAEHKIEKTRKKSPQHKII